MAPELSCAVANGQSPKEKWDNLAIAEVRCIVCDRANKVQPSCLILDIWPRSRAGILLLSHHLSSPLCTLWTVTGGFPAAALISVCLSFSISCPPSGASWKDGILNGRWDECGTICSVWQSKRLGVSRHTLVCAACLCLVMTRCVLSLQLHLTGPHNSIKARPWGQSRNIDNNEWLIWQDLRLESRLWVGYQLFNSKILEYIINWYLPVKKGAVMFHTWTCCSLSTAVWIEPSFTIRVREVIQFRHHVNLS